MVAQTASCALRRVVVRRLATAVAVLLIACLAACFCGRSAFAEESAPDHTLTYTPGKLTWDDATGIDANGSAILGLFEAGYQNVRSSDGAKVVAPGTGGTNVVRLENDVSYPVTYVAVMYRMNDEEALPVSPALAEDDAFADARTYPLPEGVDESQVVRAVTGTLEGSSVQDFRIDWSWGYHENDERDAVDTELGNEAVNGDPAVVKAGLYIVVEEDRDSGGSGNPDDPDDSDDPSGPTDPDDPSDPGAPDDPAGPGQDDGGSDGPGNSGEADGPGVPGVSGDSENSGEDEANYVRPELPRTGDDRLRAIPAALAFAVLGACCMALARRKGR